VEFNVKKICVVGAGNMGHQISVLCALNGFETVCVDVSEEQLQKAEAFVQKYLPERVAKGKLDVATAQQVADRLKFSSDMNVAADVDFVIETATEKVNVKRSIFASLDAICKPDAIFATNSSFIPSSKVADATKRSDKVCNMHFFNPALVMKCVEVVKGPHPSAETAETTMELCRRLVKIPALLEKEVEGFVANRILARINEEALWLADMGVASPEEIDSVLENSLGHPMGPFRLMDLTGLDLSYTITMENYQATGEPAHKPSPLLVEKYTKGELGRKTGKGFYQY